MRTVLLLLALLPSCTGDGGDGPSAQRGVSPLTIVVTDSIQEAIDAAEGGDTVVIPAGTYTENLDIRSSITVAGAGQGRTFLVGTVEITGMTSTTLSGLTITSPTFVSDGTWYTTDAGVYVDGDGGIVNVRDVAVFYFRWGIYYGGAANSVIGEATAAFNQYGIYSEWNMNLRVQNCLVRSNSVAGILSTHSTGHIAHNTLWGNGFAAGSVRLGGAIGTNAGGGEQIVNNIITSNANGLNCAGCASEMGTNLVWGNVTDYVNDASAAPTDLSADPLFVRSSEGDFHLSSSSPALDIAAPTSISSDFDGDERPQNGVADLGYDEHVASGVDLVISEVLANARSESTGELVEVYNAGSTSADLADLVFSDGGDVDTLTAFEGGITTVEAGAYAVIVDPEYDDTYDIPVGVTVVTTTDSTLGNGLTTADRVTLYEADGTSVISTFTHPSDPGDGISLELYDLASGDVAGNWRGSVCSGGMSPGEAACFPESGDPAGLLLTEVMANALDESTGEYVEVYNPTATEIDLAGLVISDGASSDTLVGRGGVSTLLGPREHALILDPDSRDDYVLPAGLVLVTTMDATIGNGLSNTGDSVILYASDGTTRIDSYTWVMDPGNGVSVEKIDYEAGDVPGNWAAADDGCASGGSPGRLNGMADGQCEGLLITEVMANAIDEDTGEYVEILNAGAGAIDLAGLRISDGDQMDTLAAYLGESTILEGGARALVVDSEYAGEYALDPSTLLISTDDTTLGNSLAVTDTVTLYEADGVHVIDAFLYPANPGNGISLERLTTSGIDDIENWSACTCAGGGSPGVANCAGGDLAPVSEWSGMIVITEIMANPTDEVTGEFVEVYNMGDAAVDLRGFVIYDGDADDTIEGFFDPGHTVLDPGAYAVILDSGYADEYTIPADALLLTTDDAAIASGLSTDDPVFLYEPNGVSYVDSYSWPFDPGNGTSVERVDPEVEDAEGNWAASVCDSGSSPGRESCP